ncbi:MAG: DnaJ domain-containing protein [Clostridiaceae bacterium]|nr:DnaJ domain-containing protein [Clostridiaceae bacterium]
MKDYYAILEIPENADIQEIKRAYRKLAKRYHPDVVRDDAVKMQRMYDIQEAYECLGDPENRKRYDAAGKKRAWASKGTGDSPGRQKTAAGKEGEQGKDVLSNLSQFERFFGFQPGKGMETYQDKKAGQRKKQGPIRPEELFAQFFGASSGRKGGGRG